MAVTGLPDAQPDHAVRMVRFARACMQAFLQEINRLEVMLGPGTGTLRMRCGIHSGPGKFSPPIEHVDWHIALTNIPHVSFGSDCRSIARRKVQIPTVW